MPSRCSAMHWQPLHTDGSHWQPVTDKAAGQLQFARQVAETELLTTFAEACTSTASTLEQLRQQQQQQVSVSAAGIGSRTAPFGHLLMWLAVMLEKVWPGKLLVGSTFAPCVEPINRLALAILSTRQLPEASSSSSSSSVITAASPFPSTYLWAGSLAKHVFTHDLAGHYSDDLSGINPQIVQQLASDTLLQLLAANLAFAARLLHEHLSSKQAANGIDKQPGTGVQPPAKQQQQQVLLPQPYHKELLQLLDMPALQQLELKHEVVTQLRLYPTISVMYFAWKARRLLPQSTNSSSSSSSSINHSCSGSSSCCEAAAGIPMLVVLLQVIVLSLDDPDLAKTGLQVLRHFLLDRADMKQAAVAAGLLQPVLSQLGPAVQQAAKTARSEVAAGLKLELSLVLQVLEKSVPPAGLAAAITQQPVVSCQTLEAAIRRDTAAGPLDDPSLGMSLAFAVVCAFTQGNPSWPAAAATAGAEAHLFALLASCMKTAAAVMSASSSSSAALQQASACGMLLMSQHTDAMPWLLLEARALQVFGQMVAGICTADAASDAAQSRCIPVAGELLLAECASCVEGLGPKLAAVGLQGQPDAAADALQRLMQQQQDLLRHLVQQQQQQEQDLLQQLQPVQPQGGGSSSSMVPGSVAVPVLTPNAQVEAAPVQQEVSQVLSAQLGQQLQQFGAAVLTQLPHACWCNRPGCTNLDQLSELALVGGKACICAGCTVARYCSRSCQEAHWKKQHKPVCRRLAAAAKQQ